MSTIVAIDFETADRSPDSACAVGLVRLENGSIAARDYWLIRPPRPHFAFTWLHGISWPDVAGAPTFGDLWPELGRLMHGADYLAAHNASFDRRVLAACCDAAGVGAPEVQFLCTVKLARAAWNIRPTRLPDVCRRLAITLDDHHNAAADALACAHIVSAAVGCGIDLTAGRLGRSKRPQKPPPSSTIALPPVILPPSEISLRAPLSEADRPRPEQDPDLAVTPPAQ